MIETVRNAWARRLGTDEFGVHENFFDIGGTSKLIALVCADLTVTLGREIRPVAFYQQQSIPALVRYLIHGDATPLPVIPVRVRRSGRKQRQKVLRASIRAARREV